MSMLQGLKVLDAGKILAAPLAGQILADMGADVLKIEPPTGDPTRGWGPPFRGDTATYYHCCNRNKASLVLNLKTPADRDRFQQLLDRADVLLHNFLPSGQKKFNLTPEALRERHPKLVSMGVSGFRAGTTREDEAGYDAALQGEIGLMSLNGPPEQGPYKVGVAIVDVLTGMMAANGVLAALYQRARTGKGAVLHVSLYQTGLFSLINVGSAFHQTGKPPGRYGNAHPNIVPYQSFHLADGQVVIAVGNDRQYADLCAVLGLPVDYPTNRERVTHREPILQRLQTALTPWTQAELLAQLKARKVPAAPVLTVAESFAQAARWDDQAVIALKQTDGDTLRSTGFPISGFSRSPDTAPPHLGEGGDAIEARWLADTPA